MSRVISLIAAGSLALVLVACGGEMVGAVQPDPVAGYTFPNGKGGQVIDPSFSAVEADQFRITGTKSVIVTSLGVEHAADNQTDREVGLFDGSGNLLASTTITTADPLVDGYHYKAITPIALNPGDTYIVGALHVAGTVDNYIWNTNTATTPSYIEDLGTCYSAAGSLSNQMSFTPPGGPRHYAANFLSYPLKPT